jgi:hypothetical protein
LIVQAEAVLLALQVAEAPPLYPLQDQDQGPLPATAVGVPTLQRLVEGIEDTVVPFAVPHAPLYFAATEQFATEVC